MAQTLAAHQVDNFLTQVLGMISGSFKRLGNKEDSAAVTRAVRADHRKVAAEDLVTSPVDLGIGP